MAMNPSPNEQTQTLTMPAMLDALEKMLRMQLEEHERLLALLERKREAVRQAKIDAINGLVVDERKLIERIAELERGREQVVLRLTQQLQPEATEPLPLSEIAERADEPAQTRLLGIAAQLRELVMQVRQTSSVVRSAAEALSNHISGVMQTFHAALSRAGVYGRRGQLAGGEQVEHSIDMTS